MALISRDKRAQCQATISRAFMNNTGVESIVIKAADTSGANAWPTKERLSPATIKREIFRFFHFARSPRGINQDRFASLVILRSRIRTRGATDRSADYINLIITTSA